MVESIKGEKDGMEATIQTNEHAKSLKVKIPN